VLGPWKRIPASGGTGAVALDKLRIQTKQKALLAAFRAALHPLILGHQLDAFAHRRDVLRLRLFFNLDHFLAPVLGKEDA